MKKNLIQVEVIGKLAGAVAKADIISSATFSPNPLIAGATLQEGQHIDLVGAFEPTKREADDEVMKRGKIYVDNLDSAPIEAGDLAIPLANGSIHTSDISGDLFQLCKQEVLGRSSAQEITVFKSVGHAMEDLVTASFLYQTLNE